jgi:Leucine-rich repeat (LRR) protein
LPAAWFTLTQLQELELGGNKFSGTIPWTGAATLAAPPLRIINLSGSRLYGNLPPELSTVQELYLGGNQLSGPIPSAFGISAWLRRLVAPGNSLGGAIPDMSASISLEELDLSFNPMLSGPLPGLAYDPARVMRLRLEGIQGLTGTLPISVSLVQQSLRSVAGPFPSCPAS